MLTMEELRRLPKIPKHYSPTPQKSIDHLSDVTSTYIDAVEVLAGKLSLTDWRWRPSKIEDWILGENYLNLKGTIRPVVFEDICEFFHCKSSDPWDRQYEEAIFSESIGSGKCAAPDTKVLMYSGEVKTFADIVVGDLVMGDDSTPRKVLEVHKVLAPAYEIIPMKGESSIVKHDHIISLKRTNLGTINKGRDGLGKKDMRAGEIVNISVDDYLKTSKKFKGLHKLYRVPINFKKKNILIDPYFLGLWLGDGSKNIIGITTQDEEIKNYVYDFAKKNGLFVTINRNEFKTRPNYIVNGKRIVHNHLMDTFRKYDLINNKHIPEDYKLNSREVRLKLLAGLIDTDGNLSKSNMEFCNKNKKMCEDVVFICRSLGLAAYMSARQTKCGNKLFVSYRVSISGDIDMIPTLLKRKQADKRQQIKDVLMTGIKEIRPVGQRELIGFGVDENHLFVQGDFIVTHNSFKTSVMATYFEHLLLCLRNPQRYFGIDQSSKIAIINTSLNERNARKVIFSEITQKIGACKWFLAKPWGLIDARMPCPKITSELKFNNNTFIIPGSSSWRSSVGYNIIFGIMDEASSYREGKIDYTEDMYNALQRRIGSRFEGKGGCVVAGSPLYEGDFIEQRLRDAKTDKTTMVRRRTIWESKYPDWQGDHFWVDYELKDIYDTEPVEMRESIVKIPLIPFLYKAFKSNPTKAFRDFGARPSATLTPFYESTAIIFDGINKTRNKDPLTKDLQFQPWFVPIDKRIAYFIHIDLGITGDATGFAMVHESGATEEGAPKICLDLIMRIQGTPMEPVKLEKVRQYIYTLKALGFNIKKITFDSFASEDIIQILRQKGFDVEKQSVDKDQRAHTNVKELIREKRLDFYCITKYSTADDANGHRYEDVPKYKNEELSSSGVMVKELCQLEDLLGKKVDHPPKGSKDCADALAGACTLAINNRQFLGKVRIRT